MLLLTVSSAGALHCLHYVWYMYCTFVNYKTTNLCYISIAICTTCMLLLQCTQQDVCFLIHNNVWFRQQYLHVINFQLPHVWKVTLEADVGFGAAVKAVLTPDPSLSGTSVHGSTTLASCCYTWPVIYIISSAKGGLTLHRCWIL